VRPWYAPVFVESACCATKLQYIQCVSREPLSCSKQGVGYMCLGLPNGYVGHGQEKCLVEWFCKRHFLSFLGSQPPFHSPPNLRNDTSEWSASASQVRISLSCLLYPELMLRLAGSGGPHALFVVKQCSCRQSAYLCLIRESTIWLL
jgi:hypothetical protein